MTYDIFISYSSADRPWAEKLDDDLRRRGVNCFFDKLRLTKGEKWEQQLVSQLLGSRHFAVLWSENAHKSVWVNEELVRFKSRIDPKGDGQSLQGHLLYAINLEGQNATLSAYQGYVDEGVQRAYKAHASGARIDLPPPAQAAWETMVAEIAAAAKSDNPAIPVPVAVLAMTSAVFNAMPPETPEFDFLEDAGVDDFLGRLGVEKLSDLGARYGTTPLDWHPYGTEETVRDLLNSLLADPISGINLKLTQLHRAPVRWSPVDIVTPALNLLPQTMQQLISGPCLLIIDSVSLFSLRIWQRYAKLTPCFTNPEAAIAFLTPFGDHQPLAFLRRCVTEQGSPNLDRFHAPIPFDPAYANCGINVADKSDLRRLVLASLGRQPASRPPSGAEPILSA